ncbi:MAG TPA: xanthine dehydrogenase family protein molybdopterin-binding subunit [Syntrophales bacterium]|nr:xanthine dehydrogenase family protein molybdopterin-binding subunit [Syntrophales bacterium]
MEEYKVLEHSIPRMDGPAKARGKAEYAGDLEPPGMLCGKILNSWLPHARILHIDTNEARRVPGVKAVVTGQDTLGLGCSPTRHREKALDFVPLAKDKVRYIGDAIAAVAAIDEDAAAEALDRIKVEWEELKPLFTPEEAMEPGAPLIHENMPGNISRKIVLTYGDLEEGFRRACHIREDIFNTPSCSHVPLEPHTCVARYDDPGYYTLWTGTQVPYMMKSDMARLLGIPESRVRVILPFVGGGFGSKSDGVFSLDLCAALLARETGCPVKIVYSREDEFISTRRRHPMKIYLKTGVNRQGDITARHARVLADGGAYSGWGQISIYIGGLYLCLPYRYGSYHYEGVRAFTNNPVSSAMRGHTAPQLQFASDVQLDMLAEDIGMDPVEIRLRNALESGELTIAGFRLGSCGLKKCIEKAVEKSGWYAKRANLPKGKGIGIGCAGFSSGQGFRLRPEIPAYATAIIRVNEDGGVHLLCSAADTGQGSDTAMVQIAAEELGIAFQDIRYVRADTDITPADLGSYSSRETVFAGNAVKNAAAEVKEKLLSFLAAKWEAPRDELRLEFGEIICLSSGKRLHFKQAARMWQEAHNFKPLIAEGSYDPPEKLFYAAYSFGVQVAEVEVNEDTGQVKVVNVLSAHDCGQMVNPMAVEGQLEGSIQMGIGFALSEDMVVRQGQVLNPSLADYAIPLPKDMPSVECIHTGICDPEGPFGAKECGEGAIVPTAPAIVNALYHATKKRFRDLPVTPDRVLKGGEKK